MKLFDTDHQNLLSQVGLITNLKEWNDLMADLLQTESHEDQTAFQLLRNRRIRGRDINGPACVLEKKAKNKISQKLLDEEEMLLKQTEGLELELAALEDSEYQLDFEDKNRRFLQ